MTKQLVLAVCMSAALLPTANAQGYQSARDVLDACTRADMNWIDFCNGLMQAAHDLGVIEGRLCAPTGTTRTELVQTFEPLAKLTIERNPDAANGLGLTFAAALLSAAYPCSSG